MSVRWCCCSLTGTISEYCGTNNNLVSLYLGKDPFAVLPGGLHYVCIGTPWDVHFKCSALACKQVSTEHNCLYLDCTMVDRTLQHS